DRVGCSREYICMLEAGKRQASKYQTLVRLAKALEVDVTALITDVSGRPGPAHDEDRCAVLELNLHHLYAFVETYTDDARHQVDLSLVGGVLRIEVAGGPEASLMREAVWRLSDAVRAYLVGQIRQPDPGLVDEDHPGPELAGGSRP